MSGPDRDVLYFDDADVLSFRPEHRIDYEQQASYSITVVAHSGEGPRKLTTTLDVTIEVVDGEDDGEVLLSQREPQVGREVHARVSDPDGGVRITRWGWQQVRPVDRVRRTSLTGRLGPRIDDASSSVYTAQEIGRGLVSPGDGDLHGQH